MGKNTDKTCQDTMFVTKVFTISCLLSILTTNPTNAKHLLVEIKENVKKNDDYDEKKGDCKEGRCCCDLPTDGGPCEMDDQAWGFTGGACAKFAWGGCEGNCNRFADESKCEKHCHEEVGQNTPKEG